MKKLNSVVYNKLLLQAQEAKEQDLYKLASAITNTVGAYPEEEQNFYNYSELETDVYQGLWKLAMDVIKYHDLESVDAGKIDSILETLASKIIEEIENSLGIDNTQIGPLEDIVPGQT